MRVLFVVDRYPFPPRDGVALPVARLALGLARRHQVDVAILGRDEGVSDAPPLPEIGRSFRLGGRQGRGLAGLADELLLRRPRFEWRAFSGGPVDELLSGDPYDVAWVSPVGCLGLLREAERRGRTLARAVALGLNDVATTLYVATGVESFRRGGGLEVARILRWLRLPWVWHHERRALRAVDVVHVQTPLEARRVRTVLGRKREEAGGPWILTAQNGRKTELEDVEPLEAGASEPLRVLLMAHLGPDPAPAAWWFLERVWPRIRERSPGAELELVGRISDDHRERLPEGVAARGLVDDLPALYARVSVAVVPMFRSTGLVNRALDALTAGVPLVTTPKVLATIRGAEPGEHALTAETPEEFARAVASPAEDPELARRIARAGRKLALEQPTWEETVSSIETTLEQVVGGRDAASARAETS